MHEKKITTPSRIAGFRCKRKLLGSAPIGKQILTDALEFFREARLTEKLSGTGRARLANGKGPSFTRAVSGGESMRLQPLRPIFMCARTPALTASLSPDTPPRSS